MKKILPYATLALVLVIGSALAFSMRARDTRVADALGMALADSPTVRVQVAGREYVVDHGAVLSPPGSHTRRAALETALAIEYVQHDPLFALIGTDPVRLASGSARLRDIERAYAGMKDAGDAERLDRAALLTHLYPTGFLTSLADVESARQELLRSHSYESARAYQNALLRAANAGESDLARFTDAFMQVLGDKKDAQIADVGGTIPVENLIRALATIKQNLTDVRGEIGKRDACFRSGVCDPLSLESTSTAQKTRPVSPSSFTRALKIRSILSDALENDDLESRVTVALNDSACIGTLPGPYLFSRPSSAAFNPNSLPYQLNEIFFMSTDRDAPVINYLRDSLGMHYSFVNPMTYYRCPDAGRDISDVLATGIARQFMRDHEALFRLPPANADRSERVVYASETEQLLLDALKRELPEDVRSATLETLRMFTDHGAGLDRLVMNIADTGESHIRSHNAGIPIQASLDFLFLTQSAFPSLFQAYNPSFGATSTLTIRSTQTHKTDTVRYTQLPNIPRSVFVHDLSAFFSFERP